MSVANPGFLLPHGVKAALPHVAEAAVKRSGCPRAAPAEEPCSTTSCVWARLWGKSQRGRRVLSAGSVRVPRGIPRQVTD